ncbi:hypothetical protein [Winogradskyella sp. 3972H.M.0a.05]|uniref:hypothetical protein n=1 Tax=Winogradskyella sp. 3972H.M.0a.05 TaxID=2950277 RepID=UPI003391665C
MTLKVHKLIQLIKESESLCSKDWLAINAAFFQDEHILLFAKRLMYYYEHGASKVLPLPNFSEEVTPDVMDSFLVFEPMIEALQQRGFTDDNTNRSLVSKTIQEVAFEHILVIMGQRQTPSTIKTVEGLPLKKDALLEGCFKPFNNQISVGVRAWEKHTDRTEDTFWGDVKGSPQEKQENVKAIITNIMNNYTWWNTFHHYKHGIVYEIRIESGHGMRWSYPDQLLIGFLEPFL